MAEQMDNPFDGRGPARTRDGEGPMIDHRDAFEAAIASLPKPLPRDGAAALAISYAPGAHIIWSRGSESRVRDLGAAIVRHAMPDSLPVAPHAQWVWADLTGHGPRWHLAVSDTPGEAAGTLFFPGIGYADAAENYADSPRTRLAAPPPPRTEGGEPGGAETSANTAVMAAAQELLSALREIDTRAVTGDAPAGWALVPIDAVTAARAAIALAEGS